MHYVCVKHTVTITAGDIPRLFPDLRKHISLKVVSSANTILPMFETVMQEKGLATLAAEGVDVVLNARVSAVRKGAVELQDGREIPYGLCFWAGAYCTLLYTAYSHSVLACMHACRAVHSLLSLLLARSGCHSVQQCRRRGAYTHTALVVVSSSAGSQIAVVKIIQPQDICSL
jgi:hypothetical protein